MRMKGNRCLSNGNRDTLNYPPARATSSTGRTGCGDACKEKAARIMKRDRCVLRAAEIILNRIITSVIFKLQNSKAENQAKCPRSTHSYPKSHLI
jgi:hypothetical protein